MKCRISLKLLSLIFDMYNNVKLFVRVKDGLTEKLSHKLTGVEQGRNISPNLCNSFLYDLPSIFDTDCEVIQLRNTETKCLMCADDLSLLYRKAKQAYRNVFIVKSKCEKNKCYDIQ